MLPRAQEAWGHQKRGEAGRQPESLPGELGPTNNLTLDVWSPEQGENGFLSFQTTEFVVFCYSRHGKLIQTP